MVKGSAKLFFEAKGLRIFNDDFLTSRVVENESIDLTVTSPPYSVDIKYDKYNDNIPYSEYLSFTKRAQSLFQIFKK